MHRGDSALAPVSNLSVRYGLNDVSTDTVDTAILAKPPTYDLKKVPSIETLSSEMPCKELQKERGKRAVKSFLNRLRWKKYASASISKPDPTYRVAYLGNVVTGWAKGKETSVVLFQVSFY